MNSFAAIYRQLFSPNIRKVIMTGKRNPEPLEAAINKTTTFIAPNSKWTKEQIVKEINDLLDMHFNIPLKVNMITDDRAQDFVVQHYQWLGESISRNEEANLEAEEAWMTDWYILVTREFFDHIVS